MGVASMEDKSMASSNLAKEGLLCCLGQVSTQEHSALSELLDLLLNVAQFLCSWSPYAPGDMQRALVYELVSSLRSMPIPIGNGAPHGSVPMSWTRA